MGTAFEADDRELAKRECVRLKILEEFTARSGRLGARQGGQACALICLHS